MSFRSSLRQTWDRFLSGTNMDETLPRVESQVSITLPLQIGATWAQDSVNILTFPIRAWASLYLGMFFRKSIFRQFLDIRIGSKIACEFQLDLDPVRSSDSSSCSFLNLEQSSFRQQARLRVLQSDTSFPSGFRFKICRYCLVSMLNCTRQEMPIGCLLVKQREEHSVLNLRQCLSDGKSDHQIKVN